jgi:Cu(I)/Ag(I) efflux system membrane fusion protein
MNKTIITSIVFAVIGFSAGYLVFKQPMAQTTVHESTPERKILFYRDPMNPEITSHTPKKAADGMDFVPVYEEIKKADSTQRDIAYYVDPMHPWYTSDKPGKAPDCGMDLVPVYKGDETAEGIRIDPSMVQSMGVTMEKAEKRKLSKTIKTSGIVEVDESRLYTVTTKFMGWVDRLHVDKTGQAVEKGQPLFSLYSPDLVSAQEEYLLALRYKTSLSESTVPEIKSQGNGMVTSVLKRLAYWDLADSDIKALEKRKKPVKNIEIRSPYQGIVLEKGITAGEKVEAGMPLYKIADLSTVWITADVYPQDLPFISKGDRGEVEIASSPGKLFKGTVDFIYPSMNEEARTAKVRIEMKNNGKLSLKPGMFTSVSFRSTALHDDVAISEQAVIRSGLRNIAVVALGGGYFAPREIRTGLSADGYVQVTEGIHEGENIVTSAQFLIDSESNLKAAVAGMAKKGKKNTPSAQSDHQNKSPEDNRTLVAENSAAKKTTAVKPVLKAAKTKYTCEMHPEIVKDKPGNCPICGMTLIPLKDTKKEDKKIQYTCEMHPEIIKDKPGNCPICGMFLVPKK